MNEDTRYRGLRFVGRMHNVIAVVVLGLTILVSGSIVAAGILGAALLGAGNELYRDPRAFIARGIVVMLVGGLAAEFTLGVGQMFRAVADMADNSYTVLFVLAGLCEGPGSALVSWPRSRSRSGWRGPCGTRASGGCETIPSQRTAC